MPGTWHAGMGFRWAGFWTFALMSMGLALIMTWVYLGTQRSILTALLLHFTANFESNRVQWRVFAAASGDVGVVFVA